MTIRFTPDGKVDRLWDGNPEYVDEVIDALDECVVALRKIKQTFVGEDDDEITDREIAANALRKIGASE